jgi:hypothetical protein
MKSELLSSARDPDWLALSLLPAPQCAEVLCGILVALDCVEEKVFARRGQALMIFEERQLYREFIDPEYGIPYVSLDRFLKDTLPQSWGYCRDALRARKECKEIPYDDFVKIKRCNIEQLKKVSSGVRALSAVVEAAQTLPEKAFVAEMNKKHDQHLDHPKTFKWTYPAPDAAQIETFLQWVASKAELEPDDYPGALLYLAIHENEEHAQ